jgi:hypothetical protein
VTFLVYWALGRTGRYDFQLSQANNIIHGHLDMTEEYTRNLRVLERVLYDGQGFCLPVNDPRGPESYADVVESTDNGQLLELHAALAWPGACLVPVRVRLRAST